MADGPAAGATALVPTAGNGGNSLTEAQWTNVAPPPNAASWIPGTIGVGYEASPNSGTSYATLLGLELRSRMQNRSTTAYIRIPFSADRKALESARALILELKYDDGFVAYLNGVRVASSNAPGQLTSSSAASSNNSDTRALEFEQFDLSSFIPLLNEGANMLAIHGLNDGAGSSDFLILPRLVVTDSLPPVWPDLQLGTPITNANSPVALTHAPDGSGRLFIVERAGRIRIWDGGALRTFLDLRSRVNTNDSGGDERGLLALAFSPGYATNGHFYVNYISSNSSPRGSTVISRFTVNPANADDGIETSEEVILVIPQPEPNHNGGQINFGPDGYHYIGMGDGGGAGDLHGSVGNGQANDTFLGKMLRIDVEGLPDPGLPYAIPADNPFLLDTQVPNEIWAFGLRNPWRWSFDRKTGDMYIADVGQYEWEEVNFIPAASTGGENFQWRRVEGFNTFNSGTPLTKGTSTDPVFEYDHNAGSSITGGYVYRGSSFPRMEGIYYFGDYNSGRIWGLQRDPSGNWIDRQFLDTSLNVSSFGEDEAGNLYVASL
ncbi:MAG: PQQ-dependent sugar dehydrogenase, partial [Roseibacillus sp.]|nr:PQQ-dependent sugar dehydrogenase [Roseibacillus sp.]